MKIIWLNSFFKECAVNFETFISPVINGYRDSKITVMIEYLPNIDGNIRNSDNVFGVLVKIDHMHIIVAPTVAAALNIDSHVIIARVALNCAKYFELFLVICVLR